MRDMYEQVYVHQQNSTKLQAFIYVESILKEKVSEICYALVPKNFHHVPN